MRLTRDLMPKRLLRWLGWLILAAAGLQLAPAHAARLALVIGNRDYATGALKNPVNDAEAISNALGGRGGLGFQVTLVKNLKRDDIGRTVEGFANRIRPGDEVVVFYAGHGLQVKGVNYLPAVDARIQVESDVALNSLNLNQLLDRLDEAKAGVRLLLVDACRDNPYTRGFRSTARGLARVEGAPSGTLMHFATKPGGVADDGNGANGLYTTHLLRHLRTPGLPVESMLKRVASDVRQASRGAQQPWTEGALEGEFYFAGAASAVGAAPVPAPAPQPAAAIPEPARTAVAPLVFVPLAPATSGAGSVVKDCADCPPLVVLPQGSFQMGSPTYEKDRDDGEGPLHEVRIGYRLAVGKYEVSRGEFGRFVQATSYRTEAERGDGCFAWSSSDLKSHAAGYWRQPGFKQDDSHPVVCVSWNDTQAYLAWLNDRNPGRDYRLLSEAEWEYAARAGQGNRRYPWGDDLNDTQRCMYANGADRSAKEQGPGVSGLAAANCSDGHANTAAGDAQRPNAFGLHHMHGNVQEWVQDLWHLNYTEAPIDGSAWLLAGEASRRVLRGGSWIGGPRDRRSAYRIAYTPDDRNDYTGFRIARVLKVYTDLPPGAKLD